MPRGGKRAGAGRKARVLRYTRRESIGKRCLKIGQRCENLWRESYKTNVAGMHWEGEKRPWNVKRKIKKQVAAEFGETTRMVQSCWDDYRQLEDDQAEDLPLPSV